MKSIAAAQIANIVSGCICMVPAIAAIASDSFFGTIPVISVSAFISLMVTLIKTHSTSVFINSSLEQKFTDFTH